MIRLHKHILTLARHSHSLRKGALGIVAIVVVALTANSCKEEIDTSNRYTFTGHTIASFLSEHEDMFSSFISILQRGGKYNLMRAYGTYTCFAPTNEAID
ncbi:MAG: hypothetical protein IKH59_00790, partial [Bacteroidaceae bacterium]|nr:hypothetical protein [Bacteroidaceae bacterium]